jgi:DNA (cytosine-5)-methyltransferase 1
VELFAGAGGLGLGCALSGFHHEAVVEWDRWACDTIRENQTAGHALVQDWPVVEGDVRMVDWSTISGEIDLVAGGPPCQPFSMGGKAAAASDARDMFPAAVEVIRTLQPRAVLLENVRGLTRSTFQNYFSHILLQLANPELTSEPGESWYDHFMRLQATTTKQADGLTYSIVPTLVNAADYGVPQQRHRVFIVGFRRDVSASWSFPQPSHSYDALLHSQWITGEYWERHKVSKARRPALDERTTQRVQRLRQGSIELDTQIRPWRTVRDALTGLPEPVLKGSKNHLNHVLQPGARSYLGHTGSPLDLPAKALKAGDHGVPGGENMLRRVDGSVRYFSVRESARLQTLPEDYELHGAWSEAMRQLGNAVPVVLAEKVASSVAKHLLIAKGHELARRKSGRRTA